MKICIRCKINKPINEFYLKQNKTDFLSHCKECHKKMVQTSYKKKTENRIKKNNRQIARYHKLVTNNTPLFTSDEINEWKYIVGYEGVYQVSKSGEVRRWKKYKNKWSLLSPYSDKSGYLKVKLIVKYKSKCFFVHRLVGAAFIENPYNKREINHRNGVKSDNRVENLEWSTRSENMKHAFSTGLKVGITERDSKGRIKK